jgi:hypothetical protein
VGGLAGALAFCAFLALHAPLSPRAPTDPPDLESILPTTAPGWQVNTAADLNRFSDTLQTERFVQRTYLREDEQGIFQITFYLAYWNPGQASASLVATHTPEWCWPGAGWILLSLDPEPTALPLPSRLLPPAERRTFENEGYPQQV